MDLSAVVGLTGGQDATFFEILAKQGRGKTKLERERETVRYIVAGNPISAESALKELGFNAMSTTPTTVDIYIEEAK